MWKRMQQAWEAFRSRYERRHPRPFDAEHLSQDVYLVIQASSDLDIPEFTLFVNAWEKWFGRTADEKVVERYYLRYMFKGAVPPWVREYCRQVAQSASRHQLDPVNFGVVPTLSRRVKLGLTLIGLAFGLIALLVTVAEYTVERHYQQLREINKTHTSYRP